jgi:Fe2+ transport system protein FeoA
VSLLPLHFVEAGHHAEISELVGEPHHVHHLEELGLRPGAVIEMLQPGSPCIIRLSGQKLCFRQDESLGILVKGK